MRHVKVHKDYLILDFAANSFSVFNEHLDSFLASVSSFTYDAQLLQAKFHSDQVESIVIYSKNSCGALTKLGAFDFIKLRKDFFNNFGDPSILLFFLFFLHFL